MEILHKAKVVRLRSHRDKYLVAQDDKESVRQDKNGSFGESARWTVELVTGSNTVIRLKSCYGKYLTATTKPFPGGWGRGWKVAQTLPSPDLDSTVEWEPIIDKDGRHIRLKSRSGGSFLRGSGGPPPWRDSVTHCKADHETKSSLKWDVYIAEKHHQGQMIDMELMQLGVDVTQLAVDVAAKEGDTIGADAKVSSGAPEYVPDAYVFSDTYEFSDAYPYEFSDTVEAMDAPSGAIDAGGLTGDCNMM